MTVDLPADNPRRQQLMWIMQLLAEAERLRRFNRALGTHETDLSRFPVDFVEVVIGWNPRD